MVKPEKNKQLIVFYLVSEKKKAWVRLDTSALTVAKLLTAALATSKQTGPPMEGFSSTSLVKSSNFKTPYFTGVVAIT